MMNIFASKVLEGAGGNGRIGRGISAAIAMLGIVAGAAPAQSETPSFVKENAAGLPYYNIYRPADLATRHKPLPVIIWGNGGCGRFDVVWTTLYERWASAGYIVFTHDVPGAAAAMARSMGRPMPAGTTDASALPAFSKTPMTADDQVKPLDWAATENKAKDSPYAGKLDLKHVVAAGVSCGGITSLTLASRDKRPKTVFVLSGSSAGPGATEAQAKAIMGKITVPVMWVVGAKEDIAHQPANQDYGLLPSGVPAVLIERSSGDHPTVSNDKANQAQEAEMALSWFRATLYHDKAAAKDLVNRICPTCDGATWSLKSKNLVK